MTITINGKNKTTQDTSTVATLLASLQLAPETVVIELNTKIILPDTYQSTTLSEGDQVEIIRFVGGG